MTSYDDEACSNAKKMKIDASTEDETVQDINAQFPKIDNLEYFPEKVLFHIFSKVSDQDLLHLSDTSCRFEKIARVVFKEKYADKSFVIDGESKQELYEELFGRFGRYADTKSIEVKHIDNITGNHWLTQLLRQHTNRLQKLTFDLCSFKDIRNILSEHMNVEHLALRSVYTNAEFILPEYRNLKKLEVNSVIGYEFVNLAQTIQNNPALESLILAGFIHAITFHDAMIMIAQNPMNLKHLTELHLVDFRVDDSRISADDMDSIIDSLKNLQTLKLTINNSYLDLIQRLGLACKRLKRLALDCYDEDNNFSDEMFNALDRFTTIEKLKLSQDQYNGRIEFVVGHMQNLRHLDLQMGIPDSNTFILSLLRNCPSIETITIHTGTDIKPRFFVNAQFWDKFIEAMQLPNGRVELKMYGETAGYVTKKEIVWYNMVMKWIGCEFNETNVTLLDLAKSSIAEAEPKPGPFDHILGYLDLASLHSLSAANEQSKRLVEDYVKRHAQQNETFTISDQFHHDAEGLDVFAEHVENLKVEILHSNFCNHLGAIAEQYTKLSELTIDSRLVVQSLNVFPQVRHLISNDAFSHLCSILQYYPKLETLKIKNEFYIRGCCLKPLTTCNLKRFTFEYGNESQLEMVRTIFEKKSTELIPIRSEYYSN